MDGFASENKEKLRIMAQTEGMKKHSKPVGLDMNVNVDVVVIGSVAVSRTGKEHLYMYPSACTTLISSQVMDDNKKFFFFFSFSDYPNNVHNKQLS